jgi:membrane protein
VDDAADSASRPAVRRRPPVPLRELPRRVVRGLFVHHAFDHAATMAFYFFLGTIPLLVIVGVLLGNVIDEPGAEDVIAPLYGMVPGVTGELIRKELHEMASAGTTSLAPLSILGFLWLTSNGFHNLMDVFELLIGAKPRSWLRQRAIAVGWVIASLVMIRLFVWFLLAMTGWADGIDDASRMPLLLRRIRDGLAAGWRTAGVVLAFAVMTAGGLAAFYRIAVVHPRAVRRRVWSGTLVALALWALVSLGFGAWVGSIGHYTVYYGSLATVAVTLLWFYLTSLAFVIGAEVNAQLEGVREPGAAIVL